MEAGSGLANCGGVRLRRVTLGNRFFNPMIPLLLKSQSRLRMEIPDGKAKRLENRKNVGARNAGFRLQGPGNIGTITQTIR